MINKIKNYLFLPAELTDFEQDYLARMNHVACWFFVLHLPVFVLIAFLNDTGPGLATILTAGVLLGPVLALRGLQSKRMVSFVMGVTAMFMGGLLVHFGQGPVQIEMHFYFFVLIALLAVFANPMVIVGAAVTAALHHLALWILLPASIFNYDAPVWVVAVHAAFVVLESVAACFIARSFFDNVIGLEEKVAERTAEVESRNRDMRMVLNSVKQGFFTIDSEARMGDERSAAVEKLFGKIERDETFTNVIARSDESMAEWFELGLEDVFAGFMPLELTVSQLPSRLEVNEKSLSIQYSPIEEEGELKGLAVVVSDITAEVEREKLEADSREMMAMIEGISKDRVGFLDFFNEAEKIIDSLRNDSEGDLVLLKRRVHTLKGNSAIFGMQRVADACHEIEDQIEELEGCPAPEAWIPLFSCWATAREKLRRLVSDDHHELRLSDDDYNELLLAILNGEKTDTLAIRVASWHLEETDDRLQRISEQAKHLASRLGKGEIEVKIESNGLRTESENWSSFWSSIIHVVRNAIDHGLEPAEDRCALNKPDTGSLTLSTFCENQRYIVSIEDDGRGINWDRIKDLAKERGMPFENHTDLVDALFCDGLSTAVEVSETSGRGVGMAALKEVCEQMGGSIQVTSCPNKGTEFKFSFPIETMAPQTHSLLSSYGFDDIENSLIEASKTA